MSYCRSGLWSACRPPVFGSNFYNSFSPYLVSLNTHVDFANGFAANMRLFEAAAMGVCLVTENYPNLPDLFEPGLEILTYDSFAECYEKINYCIENPRVAYDIGQNARLRALADHTFRKRVSLLNL